MTGATATGSLLLVAATVLAACGGGDESSQPERAVRVVEDELYREATDDGPASTVDIHIGDGNEGGPVVVLLHGFGMAGPGRPLTSLDALAEEIAGLGSTVFNFGWQSGFGFSADSVADFSCVGPFVAARAAEFGSDPDKVVVVGHSMGGEAGSMLALSSFDLDPSPDCAETGQASSPLAFVGIAGSYGMVGEPLDEDHTRFRLRSYPRGTFRELDADEEILAGLTAVQLYRLDPYSAIPPVAELDIMLLVGSEDLVPTANPDISAAFAAALEADGVDAEVVVVPGGDHDDVVDPTTEAGQATLQAVAEILDYAG